MQESFIFFALAFGVIKVQFRWEKFILFHGKNIKANFEAKMEQKINYPPDFGCLPRAVGNFF